MANVDAPFFVAELSKLKYAITLSTSKPLMGEREVERERGKEGERERERCKVDFYRETERLTC